jgi:O-antigen/teichoic acid export membrane protein
MLEAKAIRGVPWTVLAYVSTKVIGFVGTVVLARLLPPSDFGLLAAASLVIATVAWLGDFGLGSVLAMRPDLDERELGTVLTLMIAIGAGIAIVLAALAPVAAIVLGQPHVTGLVAALAATVFIGGIGWFYESILLRELAFRRRFVCLTLQSLLYAAAAIPLAALGAGVWSLVGGQLISVLGFTGALLVLSPYRVRPAYDGRVARDVLGTGRGFIAQGGAAFLRRNIDSLAIVRLIGSTPLGYYSMAFRLGETPFDAIAMPVTRVTFPGFARMHARGEDVRGSFLSVMRLVAIVGCAPCIILSGAAEPFVHAVFGPRWDSMIATLAVLGIWGAVLQAEATLGWFLNSVGEVQINGRVALWVLVPLVPAAALAAAFGTIVTVALVMTASLVATWIALVIVAERRVGVSVRDQWIALRPVIVACPISWVATRVAAELSFGHMAAGLSLAISAVVGTIAYVGVAMIVQPGLLGQVAGQMRRVIGRAPAVAGTQA